MTETHSNGPGLEEWAAQIAADHGFELRDEMRRTAYDFSERLRNVMYEAEYRGRPAILKLYDDEVVNVEAESLLQFHEHNSSETLTAPELYLHEIASLTRGWLLIEELPSEGRFFESPLRTEDRERFVDVFVEYRRSFPRSPNRPLALAEFQDGYRFHLFRLMQAVEQASTRGQERAFAGEPAVLDPEEFAARLERGLERLRAVLGGQPLHWGHGHIKPADVYEYEAGDRWALIDFGHTMMLPEGYEPALAIWWDQMMGAPPGDYGAWRAELDDWTKRFVNALDDLSPDAVGAGLLERSLHTVLAWLAIDDEMADDERRARLELHHRLIDDLSEPRP